MARPTTYTAEAAEEILRRLGEGEPLAWICRDDAMPATRTVSDWKRAFPEFAADFLDARDNGFDVIAYRSRLTARGLQAEKGGESTGDVFRDRLIVEQENKLLAKWDPRRYGERQTLEHTGAEGGPLRAVLNVTIGKDGGSGD
ncbi:hypothetical protein ASD78_12255 [Lysobacter sp. Root667]|uniref:terminase small subunit-like protein n=1 Tax=Lysobacter sp. Root667 TaxID=1736581 RepID=UPI0007010709|nr:hypothetical protein [Lysobacter sp. Root667]KRA74259.1 hypothetical protein ASD78_12255 [Lysobacter sp. Root667]